MSTAFFIWYLRIAIYSNSDTKMFCCYHKKIFSAFNSHERVSSAEDHNKDAVKKSENVSHQALYHACPEKGKRAELGLLRVI